MGGVTSTPKKRTDPDDCLKLVLYALPILKELTRHLEKDLDPRDRRYGFLGNIYTAAIVLNGHLGAIEEARRAHWFVGQIASLADLLEEVFNKVIDFTLLQKEKLSHDLAYRHPRLRAMQKLIPKTDSWEESLAQLQVVSIKSQNIAWDHLQYALEKLADELQRFGEDVPSVDKPQPPMTSPEASGEFIAFADRVFSTLHLTCNSCKSSPQREIRLRIGTYKSGKQGQGVKCLCILLGADAPQHIWHEVSVHDIQQLRRKPRVRFAGLDGTPKFTEPWRIDNPKTYQCICNLLDTHSKSISEFWRLNIILDPTGGGMQSHKPDERRHKRETLQQEANLNTLIASQANKWTAMTKFTLGLTLCYSLYHFYGASWTKERWSRTNIVFFGDGTQFPLRPFLSSDPQKLGGPLYDPDGYHKYPEFLELGVILLEIHLGQKLESYLGYETDISNYDDLWCKALELFKEIRSDFISTVYRDAIQKCLMANFSISDTCDEQMLRDSFFNDIVKPLETEVGTIFKDFLSIETLDEEAEKKINLGPKAHNIYRHSNPEIAKTLSLLPVFKPTDTSSPLNNQRTLPQPQKSILPISTIHPRPASRDDFEIAIVCALPLEYDAVCILIDEFWDEEGDQYGKATRDPNIYTTGRMGNRNIVLVLLPDMGKVGAASAAASLRLSFPELKLLLLTGICGGVPSPGTTKELVLGDVVLSTSIFQYDFGRRHGNKFVPKDTSTDSLGRPSKDIRSLLKICDTNRGRKQLEKQAALHLEYIQNSASLEQLIEQYLCPGAANDKLFEATYIHKHYGESQCLCESSHDTCDESRKLSCHKLQCDVTFLVERRRIKHKLQLENQGRNKEAQAPAIFLGPIGSGDTVMRSSEDRDRIAKEYDLIAFEMEGAGAWDELPCIVVKGICDYADSHKNKMWQHFAAATAASVMKALLEKYI